MCGSSQASEASLIRPAPEGRPSRARARARARESDRARFARALCVGPENPGADVYMRTAVAAHGSG